MDWAWDEATIADVIAKSKRSFIYFLTVLPDTELIRLIVDPAFQKRVFDAYYHLEGRWGMGRLIYAEIEQRTTLKLARYINKELPQHGPDRDTERRTRQPAADPIHVQSNGSVSDLQGGGLRARTGSEQVPADVVQGEAGQGTGDRSPQGV